MSSVESKGLGGLGDGGGDATLTVTETEEAPYFRPAATSWALPEAPPRDSATAAATLSRTLLEDLVTSIMKTVRPSYGGIGNLA